MTTRLASRAAVEQEWLRQLGGSIRAARTGRQWSQRELAAEAGVSRFLVMRLEAGRRDSAVTLIARVTTVLGVELPPFPRGRDRD